MYKLYKNIMLQSRIKLLLKGKKSNELTGLLKFALTNQYVIVN